MVKIAVFVSGSGSNLQSIIDASKSGKLNAEIVLVLSSKDGVYAIERAKGENIPVRVFSKNSYQSLELMYEEVIKTLQDFGVEYIVLAGYMTILTQNIVRKYKNRIINIHPALLPKFGGKGFYGMRVHEAVIASKEKISGATVHFVDEGVDTGKIIMQREVKVYSHDTPKDLQERVLEVEHVLFPEALASIFNKELKD